MVEKKINLALPTLLFFFSAVVVTRRRHEILLGLETLNNLF